MGHVVLRRNALSGRIGNKNAVPQTFNTLRSPCQRLPSRSSNRAVTATPERRSRSAKATCLARRTLTSPVAVPTQKFESRSLIIVSAGRGQRRRHAIRGELGAFHRTTPLSVPIHNSSFVIGRRQLLSIRAIPYDIGNVSLTQVIEPRSRVPSRSCRPAIRPEK